MNQMVWNQLYYFVNIPLKVILLITLCMYKERMLVVAVLKDINVTVIMIHYVLIQLKHII